MTHLPSETAFSPAFEQHVDTTQQPDSSSPTTSLPLKTMSCCLAHLHDDDEFWPWRSFTAVCQIVSLTIVQYKYKYSLQWYSLQYKDNSQHSTGYNSTKPTALPLPGKSQRTHLSTINVHSNRPKDSAHFAQPMSDNSTSSYCSMSPLIHICNDSPASSACIVPYTSWQYARAVPNVDIVGSY